MNSFLPQSPTLRLLIGAVLVSFAPILVRAVQGVGPGWIGVYRCGLAAMFLLPAMIFFLRRKQQNLFKLGDNRFWLFVTLAGLCFALDLFFWHRALFMVGAGFGTLLANTQVFYLAAFGIFFAGERGGMRFVSAIALAFVGLMFALGSVPSWADSQNYATGVFFGLFTGVAYAVFLVSLKQAELRCPDLLTQHKLALISLFSAFFLFVFSIATEPFVVPRDLDVLWLVLLALVPQFVGWFLIMNNVRFVAISKTGLILLAQPTLAIVFGAIIYAEVLNGWQIFGVLVTLVGIYLGNTRRVKVAA